MWVSVAFSGEFFTWRGRSSDSLGVPAFTVPFQHSLTAIWTDFEISRFTN